MTAVTERAGISPALRQASPDTLFLRESAPANRPSISINDIADDWWKRYGRKPLKVDPASLRPPEYDSVDDPGCVRTLLGLAGKRNGSPIQFSVGRSRIPLDTFGRDAIFHFYFDWERASTDMPSFHRMRLTLPLHEWDEDGFFKPWGIAGDPGAVHSFEIGDDKTDFHTLFRNPRANVTIHDGPGHILHSVNKLIGKGAGPTVKTLVAAELISLIHPAGLRPSTPYQDTDTSYPPRIAR